MKRLYSSKINIIVVSLRRDILDEYAEGASKQLSYFPNYIYFMFAIVYRNAEQNVYFVFHQTEITVNITMDIIVIIMEIKLESH